MSGRVEASVAGASTRPLMMLGFPLSVLEISNIELLPYLGIVYLLGIPIAIGIQLMVRAIDSSRWTRMFTSSILIGTLIAPAGFSDSHGAMLLPAPVLLAIMFWAAGFSGLQSVGLMCVSSIAIVSVALFFIRATIYGFYKLLTR